MLPQLGVVSTVSLSGCNWAKRKLRSTPGMLPLDTMPTLLVSGCAPPKPSIWRLSGEPITASSSGQVAGPEEGASRRASANEQTGDRSLHWILPHRTPDGRTLASRPPLRQRPDPYNSYRIPAWPTGASHAENESDGKLAYQRGQQPHRVLGQRRGALVRRDGQAKYAYGRRFELAHHQLPRPRRCGNAAGGEHGVTIVGADQIDDGWNARYLPSDIELDAGESRLSLKQAAHCMYPLRNDQRVIRQLLHRQRRQCGAPPLTLGRMTHQAKRFLKQRRDLQPRLRLGVVDQTDINAAGRHPFDNVSRQPLDDSQLGDRKLLFEAVDQRERELTADTRWQPDRHPPDRLVAARAKVLARVRHQLQNRHAVVEKSLASLGKHNAATVAQEQLLAQLSLEAAHMTAERRLRDVEHYRRLAEATQLGHVHEVFELLEVHAAAQIIAARFSRSHRRVTDRKSTRLNS